LPWTAVIAMSAQNVIIAVILGWLVRAAARAETDDLTGLPDRRGFERALSFALDRVTRTDRPLSLAFLDLDDFTALNEHQGNAAGDQLLHGVAQEWSALAGADVLLARYRGDRFAMLLPASTGEATALLERFRAEGRTAVQFSAGIAGRRPDDTPAALSGRAEAALDEARRAGGERVFCSADAAADTWTEMAAALTAGEFTVAYQPIVDLPAGQVTGAEALLRWNRPGHGSVPPDDFIPQAERSGFITELGRFVLESACREAATWSREVPAKITVNVSGRELHQPGYYEQVTTTLILTGLPPERLVLEVTESMLEADSPVALATLRRLRALGIRIAVDDFGTGWSSLSRLDHLPADILKIDRSFVAAIPPDATSAPLVAAITALAMALGLRTVAEGIEEPHQAKLLARHGCDEGQGWLYGRPGDGALIREALRQRAGAGPITPVTDPVPH
jgi:diguanylate cyclase (GGDEF)-like protein